MFGSEGGGDAGISEFDLIICNAHSSFLCSSSHSLLIKLVHHLDFFGEGYSDIILDIIQFFVKVSFFFFPLLLFFHDFTDVGCTYDCYSHVCVSQSSYVVGAISGIYYSSLELFEIFDDDFFVMGGGSWEDGDIGVELVREIFGGGSG